MTGDENSISGNDSDIDIYKDFSDFNFVDQLTKVLFNFFVSRYTFKKLASDLIIPPLNFSSFLF